MKTTIYRAIVDNTVRYVRAINNSMAAHNARRAFSDANGIPPKSIAVYALDCLPDNVGTEYYDLAVIAEETYNPNPRAMRFNKAHVNAEHEQKIAQAEKGKQKALANLMRLMH